MATEMVTAAIQKAMEAEVDLPVKTCSVGPTLFANPVVLLQLLLSTLADVSTGQRRG